MATLLDLALRGGPLVKLDPGLELHEQELRVIYGATDHVEWVQKVLPTLVADRSEESPTEQLYSCWLRFCLGEVLTYGLHFKILAHAGEGVWQLKTTDLRIFGWFPKKDFFISVRAETKRQLVATRGYGRNIRAVVDYRNALPLDDPKFVTGTDPHDVVSNFNFT